MAAKTRPPVAWRKRAKNRSLGLERTATARETIGELSKDEDIFVLTFGHFSLVDAMTAILEQTGPATIDLATWTAQDAHLERSRILMEEAQITRLRMILDHSFETRKPEHCEAMRNVFGHDCIRVIRTHAKFMVIRNEEWDIVVRTSMNLNQNPRLENLEISHDPRLAQFHTDLVDELFEEVAPGERRSAQPILRTIPNRVDVKEIKAGIASAQKMKGGLREPRTTHSVKPV